MASYNNRAYHALGGVYVSWTSEGSPDLTGASYPGAIPVIQLSDFTAYSVIVSGGEDPRPAIRTANTSNNEVDPSTIFQGNMTDQVPVVAMGYPYTEV